MTELMQFLTGKTANFENSLAARVYLNRVNLFFGHAVSNMVLANVVAGLLLFVLYNDHVPIEQLIVWYAGVFLASSVVAVIERKFRQIELTIDNAHIWVYLRILSGSMVAASFGIAPFLLVGYDSVSAEMFMFIVLSGIVAVGTTGYSIMPLYYFMLDILIMIPLTIFFLINGDQLHIVLAIASIIWQYSILKKGWIVSKTAIGAIELSEQLREEADDHRKTKDEMEHLAYHDPLTGLANRRYFNEWTNKSLARAKRAQTGVGFLVIDMNDFKEINDTLGHDIGDAVLEHTGKRIVESIREGDLAVRMGGDEFCIVAENIADRKNLDVLAKKLMAGICENVSLQGHELTIKASIGTSLFPEDGSDLSSVIRAADKAMYEDKKERKNRIV